MDRRAASSVPSRPSCLRTTLEAIGPTSVQFNRVRSPYPKAALVTGSGQRCRTSGAPRQFAVTSSLAAAVCLHLAILAGLTLVRQPPAERIAPQQTVLEVLTLPEVEPSPPPPSAPGETSASATLADNAPPPVPADSEPLVPPTPVIVADPSSAEPAAVAEVSPTETSASVDDAAPPAAKPSSPPSSDATVGPLPDTVAPSPQPAVAVVAEPQQAERPAVQRTPPRVRLPSRPVARAAPRAHAEPGEQAIPAPASPVTSALPAVAATPARPAPAHNADQEAAFEARIREAVQAAVRYPVAARMMGLTGRARVELAYRTGVVTNVALAQSAGSPMLDEAAMTAARTAHYPPAPPDMGEHLLRFLIWVEFKTG